MKKGLLYILYGVSFAFMLAVIIAYNKNISRENEYTEPVIDYVEESTTEDVEIEEGFIRPYTADKVSIVNNIYGYKDSSENQEKSITYYEGVYMQNTGVSYGSEKEFDVVAVRSGVVTEVLTDELVGNSITIKHDDSTYSIYQSIKDIKVKEGDKVAQNDLLAKSSTSQISKDLKNHLYFELVIDGKSVNPEECYN